MKLIKPKKLKLGDTIGILAVSGRIKEYENIENAASYFESCGYNVVISDTCRTSHRYMAGMNDDDCIKSLHNFFLNKDIDSILCARGGYGTLRLINKINWDIIRNNPKIFAGYSDITTLLAYIYKKTGLITFHSAMANGDFGSELDEYTTQSFFSTLKGERKEYRATNPKVYNKGLAKGILWGGNLASLSALCGTDFIPNTDIILFVEDLNEPVYKIDRMFTQLFAIKKLKNNVKGIVIGEFKDVDNADMLDEVITELTISLNIPVVSGFKITHNKTKDTIPYGVNAEFNAESSILKIIDSYVE